MKIAMEKKKLNIKTAAEHFDVSVYYIKQWINEGRGNFKCSLL